MSSVSRRSVAKGTAWSAPAVAVAMAAPAMAVSPVPGLQGRVFWRENCGSGSGTVTISPWQNSMGDLYPNGGDYGFYVFNTKASQVSGACMSFTYPASLGTLAWSARSDNGSWTVPTRIASNASTVTYQTCYTDAFADRTYNDPANNSRYFATVTSYPSFVASIGSACPSPLTINITRTVSVNGKAISFGRTVTISPQ